MFSSISVTNLCLYVSVSTCLMGSGRGAEWGAETIKNLGERMRRGGKRGGADGERKHKKLLFLETFLRYFGGAEGSKRERMGRGWVVRKSAFKYEVFHVNSPSARRASPKSCYF